MIAFLVAFLLGLHAHKAAPAFQRRLALRRDRKRIAAWRANRLTLQIGNRRTK